MLTEKPIERCLLFCGLCLLFLSSSGQIQYGGQPLGEPIDPSSADIPFVRMPEVDERELLREDSIRRENGLKPLRFARNLSVEIDVRSDGIRKETRDGKVVHRIGIQSPGARSLSFGFKPYGLVEGAKLFIYTPDQEKVLGSFTRANRSKGSRLATMPVPGDRAVIELIEPTAADRQSELVVERVSHAYRDLLKKGWKGTRDYGDAGECNMNVNCPDGDPWRAQKRSVAMVIDNGNRLCSGALVNNTAEDGTPYFLTASHCLDNGGPPSGWVFLFNYESPDCQDQQGPTDQSVSGSVLRARHEDSDFALVELVDTPPSAYEVFYAGWDHSGEVPDSSVCIHHPSGDIKKIAFDDDQADSAQFKTSIPNGEWKVLEWDRNTTTEMGSSGSPLFDTDGRILGQLHGGDATCQNNINDYFGRFSVSWDHHSPVDSQLQHWLDPIDTNLTDQKGYDPLVGEHPNDARLTAILSPDGTLCNDSSFTAKVEFRNLGSQPLNSLQLYTMIGNDTIEEKKWTGTLAPGEYDTLSFSTHSLQNTGTVQLTCGTSEPNGQPDGDPSDDERTLSLELRKNARMVDMNLKTDCYGAETSWELVEKESGDTLYRWPEAAYPGKSGAPKKGGEDHLHEFCLEGGCYELRLHDSYGDGMNGSQYSECEVDGELRIEQRNGDQLAELGNPDFGQDTVLSFCTDSVAEPSRPEENLMRVDPNPASGWVRVRIQGMPGTYQLHIYDMTGRVVFSKKLRTGGYRFDQRVHLPTLRSGLYLVEIDGPGGHYQRKLVIDG